MEKNDKAIKRKKILRTQYCVFTLAPRLQCLYKSYCTKKVKLRPHKNFGSLRILYTHFSPKPSPHTPPTPPLTLFQYLLISLLKQFFAPTLGFLCPLSVCVVQGREANCMPNLKTNSRAMQLTVQNKRINVYANELYLFPKVFPAILNLKRVSMLFYCTQKRNIAYPFALQLVICTYCTQQVFRLKLLYLNRNCIFCSVAVQTTSHVLHVRNTLL